MTEEVGVGRDGMGCLVFNKKASSMLLSLLMRESREKEVGKER